MYERMIEACIPTDGPDKHMKIASLSLQLEVNCINFRFRSYEIVIKQAQLHLLNMTKGSQTIAVGCDPKYDFDILYNYF